MTRETVVVVALLVAVAMPRRVEAVPPNHHLRGLAAQGRGAHNQALVEFLAAYQEKQLPELLALIAQTYEELGQVDNAITYYERYLEVAAPQAGDVESAKQQLATLRAIANAPPDAGADVAATVVPAPADDEAPGDAALHSAMRQAADDDDPAPTRRPLRSEPSERRLLKPPPSSGTITAQVVGGTLGGAALGIPVMFLVLSSSGDPDYGNLLGAVVLGGVAWNLGAAATITWIGNANKQQTGSFGAALLGTLLGTGVGVLAAAVGQDASLGGIVLITAPAIFGTIGYNMSRRPSEQLKTALVNRNSDGTISLGAPIPYMAPNVNGSGELIPSVRLLDMSF